MMKKLYRIFFMGLMLQAAPIQADKIHTIAILGDSRTGDAIDVDAPGFNKPVLERLLGLVQDYNPEAVFYTGDLVLGLKRNDEAYSPPAADCHTDAEGWRKKGYRYDKTAYESQLYGTPMKLVKSRNG
ncbi:MAG: hypothetical protein GY862_32755 [Gammaproteobacteria bacterium]|nr:hypothetical protein [Gammaproteobacteria bacterium]